jgi:hypothetical protein
MRPLMRRLWFEAHLRISGIAEQVKATERDSQIRENQGAQ